MPPQCSPAKDRAIHRWPSLGRAEWPVIDREFWIANTSKGDPFDDPKPADHFAAESIGKFAKGYARWLGFLACRGWLDPEGAPDERLSAARLNAYFKALRDVGNADETVIGRFAELAAAMAILVPARDWRWIRRPGGRTIASRLPRHKRHLVVPHARVLYDWGRKLMDTAMDAIPAMAAALQFRDGLAIAVEAARARRERSMANLQVGTELSRHSDGRWHIHLPAGRVKTKVADSFFLPTDLTAYIDHYLGQVRPFLLDGRASKAVWIGMSGQDLAQKSYSENYGKRAQLRFGISFRPHRSRHAAATSAAMEVPEDPTLAARMLGISSAIAAKHYQRAGATQAARTYDDLISRLQAEAVVRQSYRRRRGNPGNTETGGST